MKTEWCNESIGKGEEALTKLLRLLNLPASVALPKPEPYEHIALIDTSWDDLGELRLIDPYTSNAGHGATYRQTLYVRQPGQSAWERLDRTSASWSHKPLREWLAHLDINGNHEVLFVEGVNGDDPSIFPYPFGAERETGRYTVWRYLIRQ